MAKRKNIVVLTPNELQSLLEFCSQHLDNNITIEQDNVGGIGTSTTVSVTEDNEVISQDITDLDSW